MMKFWKSREQGAQPTAAEGARGAKIPAQRPGTRASVGKMKWGGVILLGALFADPGRSMGQTCDELANYAFFDTHFPLNAAHEWHVWPGAQPWNTVNGNNNMNVHGSIIIEPNATLTIDAVTIRFADSRHMSYLTNIIVKPGADLVIKNGAKLTTIASCPESMWDGVIVLGNPALGENLSLQGVVSIKSGSSIWNAIRGIGTGYILNPYQHPFAMATQTGGVVIAEDASFVNNKYDVVLRQYNSQSTTDYMTTHFFRCTFRTSGYLAYGPAEPPGVHLFVNSTNRLRVGGCAIYNNTTSIVPWYTQDRGDGIVSFHSNIQVLPMCNGTWDPSCSFEPGGGSTPSLFYGLFRAIRIVSTVPNKIAQVRGAGVNGNAGGIFINGMTNPRLNRNIVGVPSGASEEVGFLGNYGIGVWNCTGFEVEENIIDGGINDYSLPSSGMIFSNTGDAANEYYNNQFRGNLKYGTLIQHDNDGPGFNDGLQFLCNDYGVIVPNLHDIAFTSSDVSVANIQGAIGPTASDPAGNTFSHVTGTAGERHMLADNGSVSYEYWHHVQATTPSVVLPTSITLPPTLNPDFQEAPYNYTKEDACPSNVGPLFSTTGAKQAMESAQSQIATLRMVYDAERDGGNTEGFKDFLAANAANSYEIRNRLMLAAPRVSREIWEQVFALDPQMNPWHLAQALIANSPLQVEVLRMMEENGLSPFYKQLVVGAQGTGMNTLSIRESELSHFMRQYDRALNDLTAQALESEEPGAIDDILAWEGAHPQRGTPINRIALLLAKNDLAGAKTIVDAQLAQAEPDAGMEVLGMYLELKIAGLGPENADAETLLRLESIANTNGPGQGQAQAWLESIGEDFFMEDIVLPLDHRSVSPVVEVAAMAQEVISAYPNPSDGKEPVYLVVRLPEGMDAAEVQVFDAAGRLIHTARVAQRSGIVEVPAAGLPSGLFAVRVASAGIEVATTKFEVTR